MSPLKQPNTRNSRPIDSPPSAWLPNVDVGKELVVAAESIQEFIKARRKGERLGFDFELILLYVLYHSRSKVIEK